MALLGNTEDAYNQTWHLPCDDNRLTYREIIDIASEVLNRKCQHKVLKQWQLKIAGLFNSTIKETFELLPRYKQDNIFDSNKFKNMFPDFLVTTYQQGIANTLLKE